MDDFTRERLETELNDGLMAVFPDPQVRTSIVEACFLFMAENGEDCILLPGADGIRRLTAEASKHWLASGGN